MRVLCSTLTEGQGAILDLLGVAQLCLLENTAEDHPLLQAMLISAMPQTTRQSTKASSWVSVLPCSMELSVSPFEETRCWLSIKSTTRGGRPIPA